MDLTGVALLPLFLFCDVEEIPSQRFAKVISRLHCFVWRQSLSGILVASSCAVYYVDFSIGAKVFTNNN